MPLHDEVQLPNLNRPKRQSEPPQAPRAEQTAPGASDRLNQTRATAQQAAETTKIALVNAHQERLVALNNALDKAEQRRGEVLDRLSDRVAYLQDDGLFLHDLLSLSQQKLKRNQSEQPEKQVVVTTALDALVEAFDAVGDWDLPALEGDSTVAALGMAR